MSVGKTMRIAGILPCSFVNGDGRWIFDFSLDDSNFYKCSICGRQEILLAKESISEYCPYCHCGAKMDGGKDNE